jgi:oxygen-independent coproporphyrinogen-3 oxidase
VPLGLYAHIPFCARRCDYCDFFVVIGRDREAWFFEWLEKDLAASVSRLGEPSPDADTLYLGGGTPSSVAPEAIARTVEAVRRLVSLDAGAEVTLEANPETVTPERAAAWRRAGINRLSLGVQSLNDAVLRPRGRAYSAEEAIGAVRIARRAGFDNIGLDLIAGLPGETLPGFREGIGRCLDLSPEHLSLYLLETDDAGKETLLTQAVRSGRERLPAEDEVVGMYADSAGLMADAGYHHYEISNFARPGFESRHNLKYWTSQPWLGIGPSAHSHLGGRRFGRPADLARWVEWIASGAPVPPGEDYTLESAAARAREALTMALRLLDGVDPAGFSARWGLDPRRDLAGEIESLRNDGLLRADPGPLALTRRGLLLANEAFARLL